MRWLNYHHLFYFQTIANEGSIAGAAKKLRLGQPTLSAQLKVLEDALGQHLFERKNRRLVLTESGKMALDYANQIFGLGDELLEALHQRTHLKRAHIQIGVLESLPKKLIQYLIHSIQDEGRCTVAVLEGSGEQLYRELLAHKLDLVLSNFPPATGDTNQFFSRLLVRVPISIFSTKRFASLRDKFPASLSGQPFILPTLHSQLRHDIDHYFRINNMVVDVIIETQDTSVQKMLGIEGMGLVPLPEFAGLELVRERKLIKLGTLPEVSEGFWMVTCPRKYQNPIAESLMKNFTWKF
jgi:LysR family transcriptional activator of nhaA